MDQLKQLFAPDDARDALRTVGGLLLGVGMLLVFYRKGSAALTGNWGEEALLLVLLAPCVFLYGLGLLGRRFTDRLQAWQAVFSVFGLILVPLVLFQFVELVNGDTGAPFNVFWIFLVAATLGVLAAIALGVRYQLLLASIALIVSWSALWDRIIGISDHVGVYRGLLLILAAILLAIALVVYRLDREQGRVNASELVTGAGISAVLGSAGLSFSTVFTQAVPLSFVPVAHPSAFWNLVALVVSIALIVYGSRFAVRGPTYVGGIGLLLFVVTVGSDLGHTPPRGSLKWWPVVTVLAGAIAFLISVIPGLRINLLSERESSGGGPPGLS